MMAAFSAPDGPQVNPAHPCVSMDNTQTSGYDSDDKFRVAFQNASIGMLMRSPQGQFIDANAAYCTITGYSTEELRTLSPHELVHPDDFASSRQRAAHLLQSGAAGYVSEGRLIRKDRSAVPVRASVSLVRHADGSPQWFIVFVEDISDRVAAEAALRVALQDAQRANETKSRFLAATSHDLRQPLQALTSYTDALAFTQLDAKQQSILGKMQQSAQNLTEILNQLLDLSKLDAGMVKAEPAEVETSDIAARLVDDFSPLAAAKHLSFDVFTSKHCSQIQADPGLLAAVLSNLIGNAVKYTERGGILISIRPRGDRALIQVWDTGIGIANDYVNQVFEEYFQINNPSRDQKKGYGLGLSIVKRLAALLETEVRCRSRPGRSSVFEFSLRRPAEGAPTQPKVEPKAPNLAVATDRRRIVIVEDDAEVAEALSMALELSHFKAEIYQSAEMALSALQVQEPDFIICDYGLPGMNGVQFLNAIQKRAVRPIKAVLYSGETSPEFVAAGKAGNWTLLPKPIRLPDLLDALQRL